MIVERHPVSASVARDWNGRVVLVIGDGPHALRVGLKAIELGAAPADRKKIASLRALVQNSAGSAEAPAAT